MRRIRLQERVCDCCGSQDMEEIWRYSVESKTRNQVFLWDVRNVVCRHCGFAFVSPTPVEEDLEDYYKDSFSIFSEQEIDFSIENRLMLITERLRISEQHHSQAPDEVKTYIEVGSNNCPEFISGVRALFDSVQTVELNEGCVADYNSLKNIPSNAADVVTAYFVLEHISNPRDFLENCARALKQGGSLILEVPNLYLYPKDPAGIFLHEHVNHFSPVSLARLASVCGLELVDLGQRYCSRSFGFVAVFQKTPGIQPIAGSSHVEVVMARSCMLEGVDVVNSFKARLAQAREKIDHATSGALIWGANEICKMLISDYRVPETVACIDSDVRKQNYLSPVAVYQPADALEKIMKAELLVIATKRNSASIQEWITSHAGRTFRREEILELDYI